MFSVSASEVPARTEVSAAMQMRAHGPGWHVEHLGDPSHRQVIEVVQDDAVSLRGRQRANASATTSSPVAASPQMKKAVRTRPECSSS